MLEEELPRDVQPDQIRATISELEQGLEQIPLSKAVNRLDDWQRILDASDRDDLKEIARGLRELHGLLTGPNLDGRAIGDKLASLGEQTTHAADEAEDEVRTRLKRLGSILVHSGRALGARSD
jgi:hypothetical protein